MIAALIHSAACLALVGAAIYYGMGARSGTVLGAHRLLFPYVMVVGLAAIGIFLPWAMEWFVSYYSGALHSITGVSYRFSRFYWWFYCLNFMLPFLPVVGILRPIGNRPFVVAGLGVLALLPAIYRFAFS